METINHALLSYGVNALWQIPLVAGAALVAARFLRHAPARYVYAVWCAALITALLVPAAGIGKFAAAHRPPDLTTPAPVFSDAPSAPQLAHTPQIQFARKSATWTISASYAEILEDAFLVWIAFALLRFGVAAWKTVRVRRDSVAAPESTQLKAAWNRSAKAFRTGNVDLLVSSRIPAPVTIGRVIILPESMFQDASDDELAAALGHEMAHIERHDFLDNLLLEILALPISFHPATLLLRRRIRQTREMACDELVVARMMDSRVYANLLVRIAAVLAGFSQPRLALGIFDGNTLQERVRRLTSNTRASIVRARIALGAALASFAAIILAATGIALPVLAQSPATPEIRAGVQALNNNEYGAALDHFKSAIAADPSNINARLYLATACIRQFAALPAAERMKNAPADSPLFTCAVPQYKAVLALDPDNANAAFGLALAMKDNDAQSAHDLIAKVIAANPNDANARYLVGALDWKLVFPAIRKAQEQAGISLKTTQIPDAAVRQSLRAAHEAQLREGAAMLRTALQLDSKSPDAYAYLSLIYRYEALILESPVDSANLIKEADTLVEQAIVQRRAAQNEPMAPTALDPDAPPPMPSILPAPPPPPPPPGAFK